MGYTPHILVIGGGVMGTGIARDFAIRGLDVTLVERETLAAESSGQTQGLLYSGARWADSEPELARRCLAENRTLKEIASNCVEPTDGLLVAHRTDDSAAFERRLTAAEEADIPVERLDGVGAREVEPGLSAAVESALRVPDAVVDPIRLTIENARSAREYGSEIRTHTTVTDIAVEGGTVDTVTLEHDPWPPDADEDDPVTDGGRRTDSDHTHYSPGGSQGGPQSGVPGALVPGQQTQRAEERTEEIDPDYVVNASGAWAGRVAELADIELSLDYSKGTLAVADGRAVDVPVTRCREKREANTIVPSGGTCLLGTTHENVESPENCTETLAEVDLLLDETPEVAPGIRGCRIHRSACSVRPWPTADETPAGQTGTATADPEFTLLDHGELDDCWGMTTVVGGSVTTHRFAAQRVVDDVCRKFGITRGCQTDEIPLPGATDDSQEDSSEAGTDGEPNPVVCECQSVTREEIQEAIGAESSSELDLNEVRIRTTASMGDCQGGRCAHRLASQLYPEYDEDLIEDALTAMLEERWQGQRFTLWGDQLREAMRNYRFHVATLNRKAKDVDFLAEQPDHTGATEEGSEPSADSFRLETFDDGPSRGDDRARPTWGERSL